MATLRITSLFLTPKMLDAALVSFIEVSLDRTTTEAFDAFSKVVLAMDEVQECHMVAGGFDYLIKGQNQ